MNNSSWWVWNCDRINADGTAWYIVEKIHKGWDLIKFGRASRERQWTHCRKVERQWTHCLELPLLVVLLVSCCHQVLFRRSSHAWSTLPCSRGNNTTIPRINSDAWTQKILRRSLTQSFCSEWYSRHRRRACSRWAKQWRYTLKRRSTAWESLKSTGLSSFDELCMLRVMIVVISLIDSWQARRSYIVHT